MSACTHTHTHTHTQEHRHTHARIDNTTSVCITSPRFACMFRLPVCVCVCLCLCVCVSVCVCVSHIYLGMHLWNRMYACACVGLSACVHIMMACMFVCVYVCVFKSHTAPHIPRVFSSHVMQKRFFNEFIPVHFIKPPHQCEKECPSHTPKQYCVQCRVCPQLLPLSVGAGPGNASDWAAGLLADVSLWRHTHTHTYTHTYTHTHVGERGMCVCVCVCVCVHVDTQPTLRSACRCNERAARNSTRLGAYMIGYIRRCTARPYDRDALKAKPCMQHEYLSPYMHPVLLVHWALCVLWCSCGTLQACVMDPWGRCSESCTCDTGGQPLPVARIAACAARVPQLRRHSCLVLKW